MVAVSVGQSHRDLHVLSIFGLIDSRVISSKRLSIFSRAPSFVIPTK
jgi:hypothetical protein